MTDFIPPNLPFGKKRSPFFLCECPKCGFRQSYEIGNPQDEIVIDAGATDILTVETLPATCPKCGAKWKHIPMPDARRTI